MMMDKGILQDYIDVCELIKETEQDIRGHEFHYWDSTNNGTDAKALKPDGKRSWECVHMQQNLFAGFPHLSYSSNPVFAERFMREAIRWEQSQKEGSERK